MISEAELSCLGILKDLIVPINERSNTHKWAK